MQVLVTGATGFLGTDLCRRLEESGHAVAKANSANCDLTATDSLDQFRHIAFDLIFHLAAWTQAGDFCLRHPGEQWIRNQQINTNMLAWWSQRQPAAKLVVMGSSCVYSPEGSLREDEYLDGQPTPSLFTYAMTKRMLYVGLKALRQQFGLQSLCVVPSTLYGPDYHLDGRQMHFIFDVIRKILRGQRLGEPVILWGDGLQRRELVFRADFVKALLLLADNCPHDLINVGAGEEFTIRYFAERVSNLLDYDASRIVYDTTKYVGARSKCLNVERFREVLPGFHLTSLDEGLRQTVAWVVAHQEQFLQPLT